MSSVQHVTLASSFNADARALALIADANLSSRCIRGGGMRTTMLSDVYFPRLNGVSTSIRTFRVNLYERLSDAWRLRRAAA